MNKRVDCLTGADRKQDPDAQPVRHPCRVALVLQCHIDHLSRICQKVKRQGQLAALLRDQCKGRRCQQGSHHGCDPFLAINLLRGGFLFVQIGHVLESDTGVDPARPLCQWFGLLRFLQQHGQLAEEDAVQECKAAGRGAQGQG